MSRDHAPDELWWSRRQRIEMRRIIGIRESPRIDMPCMPDVCPLCSGALSCFPHAAIIRIAAKPALNLLIIVVLPFR